MSIELHPIGVVRTSLARNEVRSRKGVSQILIEQDYEEGLAGIEEFSHIFVLFWLHDLDKGPRKSLLTHPRGREDLPLVGLFATRSPRRPNPIALTRVRLLGREGCVLTVEGLDAYDGTPVIDLKPYIPWDAEPSVRVADWWAQLEEERSRRNQEP